MKNKFPKVIFDEPNGVISVDGHELNSVTKAKIKISKFGRASEVTISFCADVTLIPPDREKLEAEMESRIKSKRH